jgi:hypothetical protein
MLISGIKVALCFEKMTIFFDNEDIDWGTASINKSGYLKDSIYGE